MLRIYSKRGKVREVAIHAKLLPDLEQWLTESSAWPGAGTSPALFLNTKGGRLSVGTDSSVIAAIADDGGLDEETTAHVLRHTFATTPVSRRNLPHFCPALQNHEKRRRHNQDHPLRMCG